MPVRFVTPREHTERERRYYELHIAATGEVETRAENWHDLFNALAWIAFPRAKAAINAQHAAILEERGEAEARRRSPERDALTVFDEGGVVVASSSPDTVRASSSISSGRSSSGTAARELEATTRFLAFGHCAATRRRSIPSSAWSRRRCSCPSGELFFRSMRAGGR